ncbi:MAG: aspartyl protease family protein [Myxococcota bacterium]
MTGWLTSAFLVGCGGLFGPSAADTTWLAEALAPTHDAVPMELEPTGHITIQLDAPDGPVPFLVDTAASINLVTDELAATLASEPGVGQPLYSGLSLAGEPIEAFVATPASFGPAIDGVVGAGGIVGVPFLLENHAVIDYASLTLYLGGRPRQAARAIRERVVGEPWIETPLTVDAIGFLTVDGAIGADGGLNVVVDTGSPEPLVELSTAERLGLPLEPFDGGFATIGGEVDSFVTDIEDLRLGDRTLPGSSILVLDLSNVNDQLALAGLPAVDVLVGGALLDQYGGILDYTGESMFLLE